MQNIAVIFTTNGNITTTVISNVYKTPEVKLKN